MKKKIPLPLIAKLVSCLLADGDKLAAVTPLIMKASLVGDGMKPYHPVSRLSFISKLVERAVAVQ